MKKTKFTAILMAISLTLTLLPTAFAESQMSKALASVKLKVDIPENLTEFSSSTNESEKDLSYYFYWNDENYNDSLNITADKDGNILYYSRNIWNDNTKKPRLSKYSEDDVKAYADKFIKKLAPELFQNPNDCAVLDNFYSSYSSYSGNSYSLTYQRIANGMDVYNNYIWMDITASQDGIYVNYFQSDWDYDAKFAPDNASLDTPEADYFSAFPLRLSYHQDYWADEPTLNLSYSFKDYAGYISAKTGEAIEPQTEDEIALNTSIDEYAKEAAVAENEGVSFTDAELEELEKMDGVLSKEDAEKIIRAIPALGVSKTMKIADYRIYRENNIPVSRPWSSTMSGHEDEKIIIGMTMTDTSKKQNLYATMDAYTGEVNYIRNYFYDYDKNPKKGKVNEKLTQDFINSVAGDKISECGEFEKEYEYESGVGFIAYRMVNDVIYLDNYINYSFDASHNVISSYNKTWDDDVSDFPKPENIISAEDAQSKIIATAPLEKVYIPQKGKYEVAYTLSKYAGGAEVDAFTGKVLYVADDEKPHFTDIHDHWAEDAINALSENGIIKMDTTDFRPDDVITQNELAQMLSAAFYGGYYDNPFDELSAKNVIPKEEINPDQQVLRKDGFIYFIRALGYGEVAELKGIYSAAYSDMGDIPADKIGYVSILTGFGIISGNGYEIGWNNNLTRAEAAMMIYKYLTL